MCVCRVLTYFTLKLGNLKVDMKSHMTVNRQIW